MAFPSPALDHAEERISLEKHVIKNPNATFFMQADTIAMIEIGIFPKTLLVIDRSITPKNGDVIIADVEGEYQVRYLKKNQFKGWLCPANRKMRPVEITYDMNVQVFGVVVKYITDPKDIAHVFIG
ncbi:SOS response UmuD protein. Serine peptidase. MEROPS family S24 [Filimonas lacunae]|uniref:SOS response UmuD protein. Serine peptidase. MEROPS family S24 n=1 Tax=Filimonas lacunae TaxID=477680 RepID=A0A173MBA1_9BACT|nr:translesion error-prone DNA polymerase V autoproteolytic subunit [Filimonas lacunae]BAV04761.1 error-prone repair protein UmuD [Filimonas lacunae]SIT32143.1 SOS response UmuD protein. Serine peptidase. MEROPS family S24 [Filimonas lacunae]